VVTWRKLGGHCAKRLWYYWLVQLPGKCSAAFLGLGGSVQCRWLNWVEWEFLEVVVALRFPVSMLCAPPGRHWVNVSWFKMEMTAQLHVHLSSKKFLIMFCRFNFLPSPWHTNFDSVFIGHRSSKRCLTLLYHVDYLAFETFKCKVPFHATKAYGGSRSTHSEPRNWMELNGQLHAPAALIPGKDPRHLLNRKEHSKPSRLRNDWRRDLWSRNLRHMTSKNDKRSVNLLLYQHKNNLGLLMCTCCIGVLL
jgi:hypothetical protein